MRWLLAFLLVGCSGEGAPPDDETDPTEETVDPAELVAELEAAGPHQIGYRTVTVGWTDPLLTDGAPRELRVSLWYPTDDEDGERVQYQGVFPADDVLGEASVVGDGLPVAVFSHGHQSYGEASSYLMEHLASHGWVVAAPDHAGNLTWDGSDRATEMYLQRPLDLSAVLDWLDAPVGDPLEGRLAPERLGLGHSFGGYTLHAAGGAAFDADVIDGCDDGTPFCSTMTPDLAERLASGFREERWDSMVAMDPGDGRLFGEGLGQMVVPELLLTADFDDPDRVDSAPYWNDLDHAEDVWGAFPGLAHNGFTDVAGALDPPGVLEPEEGWRVSRAAVLAWGRARLQSDDDCAALFQAGSALEQGVVEWTRR